MKTILTVIGARPQFIKHAVMQPFLEKEYDLIDVHTGQHFDENMSDIFFDGLGIHQPSHILNIRGASQGEQTGRMLVEIERICMEVRPSALLVYGDTNSTLAGVLAAVKLQIPIIHIEAGLRSFNRSMPEEINRIVADEFSELLFCPTTRAIENLRKEGIDHDRVFLTGDIMCDLVLKLKEKAHRKIFHPYYYATIHRPYNVDDERRLGAILDTFNSLDKEVVFPIHPRTLARMKVISMDIKDYPNINFIEPVGYIDSISLQLYADCIITDSGGMQKEAYILRKKCITVRSETEWEETLLNGWNQLVFDDLSLIPKFIEYQPGFYKENVYGNGSAALDITNIIKVYV